MSSKKYLAVVFSALAVLLALAAAPIINIDPFMHYHMPKEEYLYSMYKPWYLNYGIIKNFDYNALITGTSMTDNFKTSEADAIFGTNTIKVPFDGASFKEIDMAVREACEENDNLKLVIRGLDPVNVFKPADYEEYGEKPTYLYDDIIFNDVPYIFNKEILINETFFNTIIYNTFCNIIIVYYFIYIFFYGCIFKFLYRLSFLKIFNLIVMMNNQTVIL